jgi:hypothetical protein
VSRREDFDQWPDAEQRLEIVGFSKWYVPCLWKIDLDRVLFDTDKGKDPGTETQFTEFRKHLEFVGRGSFGKIIDELRKSKNTTYGPNSSLVDVTALVHRDEIRHNAWMQDVLDINWPAILGNLFVGKYQGEKNDRARIGIYYLLDWITERSRFTEVQLFEKSGNTPITISDDADVVIKTIRNLIRVLNQNRYLECEDEYYRVIWDQEIPPKPQAVRSKSQSKRKNNHSGLRRIGSDTVNTSSDTTSHGTHKGQEKASGPVGEPSSPGVQLESPQPSTIPEGSSQSDEGLTQSIVDEDSQRLRALLAIKRRRLFNLEVQQAQFGVDVPAHITMEIEDLQQEIVRMELRLKESAA